MTDASVKQFQGEDVLSVDPATSTEHINESGAVYVLCHATKQVFLKVVERDGQKLRATGGDYDQFVSKLPQKDVDMITAKLAPPPPKKSAS